jgi:flagellar hook-associated protein 1 FlgK
MSLSVASSIALSALKAAQVGISVTSSNIANADVEGYTKKTATQVSVVTGGSGSGTAVTSITGGVDKYVFSALLSAKSDLGAASVTTTYTDRLQTLMGSTTGSDDGGTSIATEISALETAVTTLASSPDDSSAQSGVVSAADSIASSLRETSASIQELRSDADQQIADDVDTINTALNKIAKLNDTIADAQSRGLSTADLEDERNTAIASISDLIDITTTTTSTGSVYIKTTSGTALLTNTVHELSFSASSSMTATTVTSGITVDGKDITSTITSGEVGALLTLRDETLPDAQDELDALAAQLISVMNEATADGSSVPAPDSLTGTTSVASTDSFSASGTVRIALVDEDGLLTSYADLDLSSYSTIGDLVDALDAIDGISASLTSSGTLSITSDTSGSGVAIGALDSSVGSDGQSFSSYFGMNALFNGSGAADIKVSSSLLADSGTLPVGTLSSSVTTTGKSVLASGSTTVADAMSSALTTKTSYDAVGSIGSTTVSLTDYASLVVSANATRYSDAATAESSAETLESSLEDTLASQSGVNVDEETARLADYQSLYSAAAQIVQIAKEMFETLLSAVK